VVLGGCGKKGPPLPPLRPQPARITELSARAVEKRVDVSILVPAENADGTTPSVMETIELYALVRQGVPVQPVQPAQPAQPVAAGQVGVAAAQPGPTAPRVTAPEVVQPQNLVATAKLDPPAEASGGAEDPSPPRRATVTHDVTDLLAGLAADEPQPTVYYVAIGLGRGRRSPVSPVVEVPLGRRPGRVAGLGVTFDATSIVVSWEAPGESIATYVDEIVGSVTPPEITRRSAAPVSTTSFSLPVTFGQVRCFTARHVVTAGRASVEGPAAPPVCVTPVDAFAPPAPTALVAIAEDGTIVLSWRGVSAADFAGYLVLRAEGPNETLQPLTPSPVAERSYRDATVRAGVTYTYAVVAIDRAQPPNRSQESNRQTVVAR
jgi:hypothetical protein